MSDRVRLTALDPVTGESEVQELDPDGYVIFCGENRYVAHEMVFPKSGTIQLTIKRTDNPPEREKST